LNEFLLQKEAPSPLYVTSTKMIQTRNSYTAGSSNFWKAMI